MPSVLMAASMQVGAVIFSPGEIVNFSDSEAEEVIRRGLGYPMLLKAINAPPEQKIARRYTRKQTIDQSSRTDASPLEE
jgi:hypothetical protein